jgi:hypothetical protein
VPAAIRPTSTLREQSSCDLEFASAVFCSITASPLWERVPISQPTAPELVAADDK